MRRKSSRLNLEAPAKVLEGFVLSWILKMEKAGRRSHVVRS